MEKNFTSENPPLKVLIVEDSLRDLELLTEYLSQAGYHLEVSHVEGESQYKDHLEEKKFDIILSDFRLPGFDAFKALEISQIICPEVPFICVSGSIGEETAIELLKKGAVDYVLKDRMGRLPFAVQRALQEVKEKAFRIQADRELKESENRFRQVAETAQEWIWEVNAEGLYTYSSPVVETLLGYTPEEIVDKKYFYDLYPPDKKEALKKDAFEIFSKKQVINSFVNPHIHKNGQLVYISSSGRPVFDEAGNLVGYRGADEDITERLKAEENLKLLNRAVEASSVSVIITNAEGNIIYVNPYFTQLSGYTLEESHGRNPGFLKSGEESEEHFKKLLSTINPGKDWTGEFRNRKKNGEVYWENAVISPILDNERNITNFVILKEDITERKRMLAELVRAKEKAEEGDRLKTAFINNISHEIRTPLNGILGFSHMMAEYDLSLEKRREYFKHINHSSDRLLNTITDYMDMAMIVSKTMKIQKEEFLLAPLFETIVDKTKQLSEEQNLKFKILLPKEKKDLVIYSNSEIIQKILKKLLDNAIKFTRKGSISCGYRVGKQNIEFFVKDTGSGIEKDKLEGIFKIFNQEDVSMTREYEGSGLGLSIAKSLAKLLGGDITVTSEKGRGSEFTFTIPYKNPELQKPVSLSQKQAYNGNSLVLIAEDDKLNYLFIKTILDSAGYNHIHALNGLEAVNHCKSNQDISLVLMDIQMPVMNGIEATSKIREFKPGLPIIATTAYAQTGDKVRFLEAGCSDYLPKPINKEKLINKMSEFVKSPELQKYR